MDRMLVIFIAIFLIVKSFVGTWLKTTKKTEQLLFYFVIFMGIYIFAFNNMDKVMCGKSMVIVLVGMLYPLVDNESFQK